MVMPTFVFGRYFLEDKLVSLSLQRKCDNICTSDKIWTFTWQLEFRRLLSATASLITSQIFKGFLMRRTAVLFIDVYRYQHLEYLHSIRNPFSKWPIHDIRKLHLGKQPIQNAWPMNRFESNSANSWVVSDVTLQLIFKNYCLSEKNIHNCLKSLLK